ncbi:MAG: hypothetical protein AAF662_02940 [Pseudomonadota bacterium]
MHEGYLDKQLVWNRYFWMYRIAGEKLLPWWLEHHQQAHRKKFSAFQAMCVAVSQVPWEKIEEFERRNHYDF